MFAEIPNSVPILLRYARHPIDSVLNSNDLSKDVLPNGQILSDRTIHKNSSSSQTTPRSNKIAQIINKSQTGNRTATKIRTTTMDQALTTTAAPIVITADQATITIGKSTDVSLKFETGNYQ